MATYRGKFTSLDNPDKYAGDPKKILYRSCLLYTSDAADE